jgi:hypothetical protein
MSHTVLDAPRRRVSPPRPSWQRLSIGGSIVLLALVLLVTTLVLRPRAQTGPRGAVDAPQQGAVVTEVTEIHGWAIDQAADANAGTGVDRVQLVLDGTPMADAQYGDARPDIATGFGAQFEAAGWSAMLDPRGLASGPHTLEVRAHSRWSGTVTTYTRTLLVRPASAPHGAVDVPADGAVLSGSTDVRGWAIDQRATDGSGVDAVRLYLDGQMLGEATYGAQRADVGASFGSQFGESGWSATLDPRGLPLGQHTLEVRAHSLVSGEDSAYTRTVVVQAASAPRGSLDVPEEGSRVVRGMVDVRGWAIDEAATNGTGIDRVQVYLDDALVAEADLGNSRPEIAAAYGARFGAAGWAAMIDVSGVSAGPHRLEARARSTASGQETSRAHTVVVQPDHVM